MTRLHLDLLGREIAAGVDHPPPAPGALFTFAAPEKSFEHPLGAGQGLDSPQWEQFLANPFANGYPARIVKMNRINLERRGLPKERIDAVERAFRIVFRDNLSSRDAFAKVRSELPDSPEAERMVAFLEKSERGFARRR